MKVFRKIMIFTILVSVLGFASCEKDQLIESIGCIEGEEAIITQTLSLSSFEGIDLTLASNVTIYQGVIQEIKVIEHPNIIAKIKIAEYNNIWKIEFEDACSLDSDLKIKITIPNLKFLKISGSGNVIINDFLIQSSLENILNGSGNITLNEFDGITNFNTELSGSGSIQANNKITNLNTLNVNISGSGNYHGFRINSNIAKVKMSGSGYSELTTLNNLNVISN